MNHYEQKQADRRARLEARASALASEGQSRLAGARRIYDAIPFGQPILVGHHSERRHRRDIARAAASMRKGFGLLDAAGAARARAAAIGTGGISADDPDALVKLRAELAQAQADRAAELAVNISIRGAATRRKRAKGAALDRTDHLAIIDEVQGGMPNLGAGIFDRLRSMARAFPWLPQFGPNGGRTVAYYEKRIADLERARAAPAAAEVTGPGFRIAEDRDDHRLRVYFDAKPPAEVRERLKACGFRWAPSVRAWQKRISAAAWRDARWICGVSS